MNEEVELKLAVAPEDVERLKRHPILRGLGQKRPTAKRLVSVYYDTPVFTLMREAVALRVRKVGSARIQTIKREAAAGRQRIARHEWEGRIKGDQPDLSQLDDPELRRLIGPHAGKGELKPVFVTDVLRRVWPLRVGASEIHCAIDVGEINADGRREPVCEVELELKSGAPAKLFELARELNASVPLRLEPASKAARGYSLATGTPAKPRKGEPVHLQAEMTVAEAFVATARTCIAHIVANVDCAYEGKDPEGVHQLRVGIRRLRAAFAVFREVVPEAERTAIAGELRWLQQELGPAREWDVFINGTLQAVAKRLGNDGVAALLRAAEAQRAEAYERARTALVDRRTTDLLLRLEGWLDGQLERHAPPAAAADGEASNGLGDRPIMAFAAALFEARHGRVHKLGSKLRKLDQEQLHELRIRVKKLRYATEFFRDLHADKFAKRYVAALKDLQEALGAVNDTLVAGKLIIRLEESAGLEVARAAGQIEGWCAARFRDERRELATLWQAFARLKPFWRPA